MILTVAGAESRALARSPLTWFLAAAMATVFAFFFLQALEAYLALQPKLALQDHPPGLGGYLSIRYCAPLVFVFALIAPLIAMRSFSDEFRAHTIALWLSSPVSTTSLVVGKFIGILAIVLPLVALAIGMTLIMRLFTALDLGVIGSSMLGLMLAASLFSAIGLFFSSLTRHAILAVVGSVLLLLLLWLVGGAATSTSSFRIVSIYAVPTHLSGFFQGFVGLADIGYFVLLTLLFLGLTIVRLDALRHSGQ